MKKWDALYWDKIKSKGGIIDYVHYKISYKKKLINKIKKYASAEKKIIEIGCGTGITCCYLKSLGYEVIGVDNDEGMLKLAKNIASVLNIRIEYLKMDINSLEKINQFFDVSFSNGVLEHFSDSDIINIINKQLIISKFVIVSVPSNIFSNKDRLYGNERFLSISEWKNLINYTEGKILEIFGFNFKNWLQKVGYIFYKKRFLKLSPFIVFVINKK